jgi:protein gp37
MRVGLLSTLWNGKVELVEKHLLDPLKWRPCYWYDPDDGEIMGDRPRRIFVNSMSDLFHESVTDEMRDRIFAVMALCPQHIFQVLTKRPDRMLEYLSPENKRYSARRVFDVAENIDPEKGYRFDVDAYWPLENVWLGVSVENQGTAKRIWPLLNTPAAMRFVSCEPLLGAVDLDEIEALCGNWRRGATIGRYLDWVICGGESGPGARPMHPDWACGLRDQCTTAGVPFFFKQWGEWLPACQDGTAGDGQVLNCSNAPVRVGKRSAGCLLDGVEHKAFPAVRG